MCLLPSVPEPAPFGVAEAAASVAEAPPFGEKTLAAIWNAQRPLQGPFWTTTHEPVAIIYRGHWSGGAGPDFRGAILALGGDRPQRGDIEIHLRAAGWYAHGHHTDPAYNDVALHVVYSLGGGGDGPLPLSDARRARTAAGREVPTLVLAPHIAAEPAELSALAPPEQLGDLSEEPCWQRTQNRRLEEILATLAEAGEARFAEKSGRYEADLAVALDGLPAHEREEAAEQLIYSGVCDGLGYSANRAPFVALAARLPLRLLRIIAGDRPAADRASVLEALLLGGGGLLPSQRPTTKALDWRSEAQAEELERQWAALRPLLGHLLAEGGEAPAWKWAGVRPANSPARRMAALAHLLSWLLPGGLLTGFVADVGPGEAPGELASRWLARLEVAAPRSFWEEYSDFGSKLGGGAGRDLIGLDRAGDLLANILLPYMAAWGRYAGLPALAEIASAVYAAQPRLAENQVTRAMLGEVFGPRARKARLGAREQQGLIGLYRRYCSMRDVYECPLSGLVKREPERPSP